MENFEKLKSEFTQIANAICPGFKIDIYNRQVVSDLFNYTIRKEGNLDIKKGIWLEGPNGTGKSTLLRICAEFQKQIIGKGFLLLNCSHIATQYANGEETLDKYTYAHFSIPNRPVTMAFDELGREPIPVYRYNTSLNIMQFILQIRYNLWQQQNIIQTHITTNFDADDIERLYGDFIRDRRKEFFNIISLEGPSRR